MALGSPIPRYLPLIVVQPVTHISPAFARRRLNRPVTTLADIAVLVFGDADVPRPLAGLRTVRIDEPGDVDAAIAGVRRVVVVGVDADLATVLTRLLRAGRLDVEVGYAPRRRTAATRVYRVPAGRPAAPRGRRRAAGGGGAGAGGGRRVTPLAGRAGGAAGHHRCRRGPRRRAGAEDGAPVDVLSQHRRLA